MLHAAKLWVVASPRLVIERAEQVLVSDHSVEDEVLTFIGVYELRSFEQLGHYRFGFDRPFVFRASIPDVT